MLREAGASEVHIRITCPPLLWPCFYGIDTPTREHLIAAQKCVEEIRAAQQEARETGVVKRPRWPMIVLRSPKGWTGPKEVNGHKVEGF